MGWCRLLGGALSLAAFGCSTHVTTRAQAAAGPALAVPAQVRAAAPEKPAPPERPKSERPKEEPPKDDVKTASFIVEPSIRAAISKVSGLPEIKGKVAASVMARVNGQPILFEEVYNSASFRLQEIKSKVPPAQWDEVKEQIQEQAIRAELEEIIVRELVIQDCQTRIKAQGMDKIREVAAKEFEIMLQKQKRHMKIKSDEEFRARLESEGRSLDEMRRQFERSFVMQEYLRSRIREKVEAVTREQQLEYYQNNRAEFDKPERVRWQHIFIDVDRYESPAAARKEAEGVLALVKAIKTDAEFGPIAEKHGHGPSQYRKGEGEGKVRGQIRPEDVEDIVFTLKAGEVGPLVEVSRGFHIVRVVDHQPAGRVPFEKACADIKKKLQSQIGQAEYTAFIKELRSKAYIENAFAK